MSIWFGGFSAVQQDRCARVGGPRPSVGAGESVAWVPPASCHRRIADHMDLPVACYNGRLKAERKREPTSKTSQARDAMGSVHHSEEKVWMCWKSS